MLSVEKKRKLLSTGIVDQEVVVVDLEVNPKIVIVLTAEDQDPSPDLEREITTPDAAAGARRGVKTEVPAVGTEDSPGTADRGARDQGVVTGPPTESQATRERDPQTENQRIQRRVRRRAKVRVLKVRYGSICLFLLKSVLKIKEH